MDNFFDVIIIGAGPAGLFGAVNISREKKRILIIEKNSVAGKKLLLTGGGKCNITNSIRISDFFSHYNLAGRKFIKKALYNFDNKMLLDFFKKYGINFKTDSDNRVIPENGVAEKIRNILIDFCKKENIKIIYNSPVKKIDNVTINNNKIFQVYTENNVYSAKRILLATGGCSYPLTGSTGDGFKFASDFGHNIISVKPALSQLFIKDFQLSHLAGSILQNARLTFFRSQKKIASVSGEILITHKGVSGIPVINISREIIEGDKMCISFIDNCEVKIQSIFKQFLHIHQKYLLKNLLKKFDLQERVRETILKLAAIENNIPVYNLSREDKNRLFKILTEYETIVYSAGDFNTSMVTSGGVALNEINSLTMESLIKPGLFFAGEIMDIDGDSGGYNLQAAFSTAKLAAKNIIKTIPGKSD